MNDINKHSNSNIQNSSRILQKIGKDLQKRILENLNSRELPNSDYQETERLKKLAWQDVRRHMIDELLLNVSKDFTLPNKLMAQYDVLNLWWLTFERYKIAEKMWFEAYLKRYNKIKLKQEKILLEKEDFKDLVVVLTIFYPKNNDRIPNYRKNLTYKFLRNLNKLNIKCVVWDWWSEEFFLDKIKQLDNIKVIDLSKDQKTTLWKDRANIISQAVKIYPHKYYFQTEAEKVSYSWVANLYSLLSEIKKWKSSIVLAKRIDKISMPDFHAREETRANKELGNIMMKGQGEHKWHRNPDLYGWEKYDFFGSASIFDEKGAQEFLKYKSELDKRDRFIIPIMMAWMKWQNIGTANVDLIYNIREKIHEQGEGENIFKMKRLDQYKSILEEARKQAKK